MILVNVLIFVIFSLLLVAKYDKAIAVISVWSFFLNMLVLPVRNVSVFGALLSVAFVLYVIRNGRAVVGQFKAYPMASCTLFVFLFLILTNAFSGNPHWLVSISFFVPVYLLPFLLWNSLDTPRKVGRYVRLSYICAVISVAYCFVEVVSGRNPIMEWMVADDMVENFVGLSDRFRFGIKRIQGFFALNGALGGFCTLNMLLFLFLKMKHEAYVSRYRFLSFLIGALALCAFFTGTRSVILAWCIGMMYVVNRNLFRYKWTYFLIVGCIVVFPFVLPWLSQIYMSFLDMESIAGSNLSMRETQFELTFYYLKRSFWIGNGISYTFSDVLPESPDIKGAESVWIPYMIERGILGTAAYAFLILYSLYYCIQIRNKAGFFMVVSFIVLKSLTSAPGISEAYFLAYVVLTSKITLLRHGMPPHPATNDALK